MSHPKGTRGMYDGRGMCIGVAILSQLEFRKGQLRT